MKENLRKSASGKKGILLTLALASLALTVAACADEMEPISYPPQPDEKVFTILKQASPFLRTLDISETYVLKAVATFEDVAMARVYNKETKQTMTIMAGEEKDAGLALVEVIEPRDPTNLSGVTARVSFAGETAELKYDTDQLTPARGSARPSRSGRDGRDSQRRGPSSQDRERYKSMSEEQRNKLRDYIRMTMKKYPDMPGEERGNLIRGAMQKLIDGRPLDMPSDGDRQRR